MTVSTCLRNSACFRVTYFFFSFESSSIISSSHLNCMSPIGMEHLCRLSLSTNWEDCSTLGFGAAGAHGFPGTCKHKEALVGRLNLLQGLTEPLSSCYSMSLKRCLIRNILLHTVLNAESFSFLIKKTKQNHL